MPIIIVIKSECDHCLNSWRDSTAVEYFGDALAIQAAINVCQEKYG